MARLAASHHRLQGAGGENTLIISWCHQPACWHSTRSIAVSQHDALLCTAFRCFHRCMIPCVIFFTSACLSPADGKVQASVRRSSPCQPHWRPGAGRQCAPGAGPRTEPGSEGLGEGGRVGTTSSEMMRCSCTVHIMVNDALRSQNVCTQSDA